MLAKIRHYVSTETVRSVYYALFSSHMSYGCIVWGQKGSTLCGKLSTLQNKAMRIILFSDFNAPSKPLFHRMGILQLNDVVTLENFLFAKSFVSQNLPVPLQQMFSLVRDGHEYHTRSALKNHFTVPNITTTKYGLNSINYQCVKC